MANSFTLDSKPLRERIADRIRSDIVKGIFGNGERLIEPKLAEIYGISRTPIREALRQLESEGFIEIVPRKGAVVKELTLSDIDNLYAIKANLEGLAARQAVENITDRDIEKLISVNEKFISLFKGGDGVVEEYLKYNISFHNYFIKMSNNVKLVEILEGLNKNFQRFRSVLVSKVDRVEEAYLEHNKIIEAFRKRNAEYVEKAVRYHIESGWNYLRSKIQGV
ncbi:MAG: GntR family transcriptional regulator [Calditerrivibrio sp.]|nr:GntR family transcriptional regulator [Calditerrivibrio sp.]MCA1933236.1 GntR family transcriptional regulator [Calditerrivibrio sp.]MCA1980922.1 GntR family transcriptional regulator [Calditerrivibrio sp.]